VVTRDLQTTVQFKCPLLSWTQIWEHKRFLIFELCEYIGLLLALSHFLYVECISLGRRSRSGRCAQDTAGGVTKWGGLNKWEIRQYLEHLDKLRRYQQLLFLIALCCTCPRGLALLAFSCSWLNLNLWLTHTNLYFCLLNSPYVLSINQSLNQQPKFLIQMSFWYLYSRRKLEVIQKYIAHTPDPAPWKSEGVHVPCWESLHCIGKIRESDDHHGVVNIAY